MNRPLRWACYAIIPLLAGACTSDDTAAEDDDHDHDHETEHDSEDSTDATSSGTTGASSSTTDASTTSTTDDPSDGTTGAAESPFSLGFQALAGGEEATCGTTISGVGPDGNHTVGVSDLRFYISNLRFLDASGAEVPLTLDDNEFQYSSDAGDVALIDLTSNSGGDCEASAISFAEGTARTNDVVTGTTQLENVASIAFDIGVPQAVMQDVIATNTAEAAPSPLGEMYWSWATGYRHFVFNFAVRDDADGTGDGYIHIGSRDCAAMGALALEDRDECGFINTPTVEFDSFDLENGTVTLDLAAMMTGLDFVSPIYDPDTFEVIGMGPGVECHSSPMQEDCMQIFGAFGLDMTDGTADSTGNQVFSSQ